MWSVNNKIKIQLLLEYLIIVVIATVISLILTWKYIETFKYSWILVVIGMIILAIVFLFTSIILKNKNIVYFCKRKRED